MNADQHGSRPLAVRKTNTIIQFNKMIVLAHHHGLQTGTAQFIANPLRRIERQVLLPQKDRSPSSTDAAAIFSAVTRIDDDRRKMPGRQPARSAFARIRR